ncbi:MAG: sigma 54-interacting transcriptional regulator [Planctomycetes bacterium]|nr:sigma 54-interacting transcriptional regulator [Planctomycetota bacterium]
MPFLVLEEKGSTSHYQLHDTETTIGRAPDNTVMLTDEKASRHHCALVMQPDRSYVLKDLSSRNGTYLRGDPVIESGIEFGDVFQIGLAKLTVYSEESSAFETKNAMDPILETMAPAAEAIAIGIHEALEAFSKAGVEYSEKNILESTVNFVGAMMPGIRAVICIADNEGNAAPRAFFNFISGTPTDELPPQFKTIANRLLSPRAKTQVKPRTTNYPDRVYIPLKCGDIAAGILYVERESKDSELSESQVRLLENCAKLVAVCIGAANSKAEQVDLEVRLQSFNEEMDGLRDELEAKLDMQTAELTALRMEAESRYSDDWNFDYSNIIGNGAAMQEIFRILDKITDLPVPVLILGEPGTGKELIAKALHFNSKRARTGKFVAENCAALPDALFESELFGYVRGAFTGADRDKDGLFGMANNGTIFLDEIGEISPSMQAKLLRVLEEGEIRPIGGKEVRKVDFRLVCATNRDLTEHVRQGGFRQDLFFRINVVTVRLPSLRERTEDIPQLTDHFLKIAAKEAGRGNVKLDKGVLKAFMSYDWPGNVRELENEVKKLVALSDGNKIDASGLSPQLRKVAVEESLADSGASLKEVVESLEKRKIMEAMELTGGNKSRAAEALGLSRLGLRKKMERYGLSAEQNQPDTR